MPRVDREASGPSYSVTRLCESLAFRGHTVDLLCIAARHNIPNVTIETHSEWPILKRFEVSTSLTKSIMRRANAVDIVHNHSLWSMINVAAGLIVPGKRAKLVCSPRGTLSPWAMSRAKHLKRLLKPFQWNLLKHADLLHATSIAEYHDIRAHGFKAPVAIIPNGIDLPDLSNRDTKEKPSQLIYVGRLHPTKCIDRILQAWQILEPQFHQWELTIIGSGDPSYEQYLKNMVADYNLYKVRFTGPLYGVEKSDAYRKAGVLILPSHTENFGMVVAEALAHECPVIASKGTPWSGLVSNDCGWWVDHDVDTLIETMAIAMSTSTDRLHEMGAHGRDWMRRDFSWESVAGNMEKAYEWVLSGFKSRTPEFIQLS